MRKGILPVCMSVYHMWASNSIFNVGQQFEKCLRASDCLEPARVQSVLFNL